MDVDHPKWEENERHVRKGNAGCDGQSRGRNPSGGATRKPHWDGRPGGSVPNELSLPHGSVGIPVEDRSAELDSPPPICHGSSNGYADLVKKEKDPDDQNV
jgi:hypothetical protein